MESGNIGTDNVNNLGFWVIPELLELGIVFLEISESGNVVCESVEPDIDNVAFRFFYRNAPIEGGSGDAKIVEARLDEAHITANKNTIPNDPQKPFVTSGIRLGTPAVTTRGFNTEDMDRVAEAISLVVLKGDEGIAPARDIIKGLTEKYPLI